MKATIEDLKRELWLRKRNQEEIVWTTVTGEKIPINKMTSEHLINAIKYFERKEQEEWFWRDLIGDSESIY